MSELSESDDSVSVGHFVLLMMAVRRFFDIPSTSSKQYSWILSMDLPCKKSGAICLTVFGFKHIKVCRINSTRSPMKELSGFMSSGSAFTLTLSAFFSFFNFDFFFFSEGMIAASFLT
jgi:hypothetical protein